MHRTCKEIPPQRRVGAGRVLDAGRNGDASPMWTQLEFDFDKVVRRDTDYDLLARFIEEKGEVTFREIVDYTQCTASGASQVIDTLSLRYPLWSPRRGVYKMLTREDRE